MSVKIIDKTALDAWVEKLIERQKVYGPCAQNGRFVFNKLENAKNLRLDYDVTILPPKKYFLPEREALLNFNRKKVTFESLIDKEPFTLLGVHPYDFVAIAQLDKIFSMGTYDAHYMTRSKNATIIVSDVQNPSSDVFAGGMDCATVEDREGYDILLTLLKDGNYLVDSRSEKGDALLQLLDEAKEANEKKLKERENIWAENREVLQKHKLNMPAKKIPEIMSDSQIDHPVFIEKSNLCYSCGSCNLVCPTCYCFDVQDELDWNLETGKRYRAWDGCMLRGFAETAGGHNFREKKVARYRHRYYRKGKYVYDMIDELACVGCGRCITACTANIANPVEVFNRLNEGEK